MELIKIECPCCNGNFGLPDDSRDVKCPYCGSYIYIKDDVKRSEHVRKVINVDETKIKEAETKADVQKSRYDACISFVFIIFALIIFLASFIAVIIASLVG